MKVHVPDEIRRSALFRRGGWSVLTSWPEPRLAAALLGEALTQMSEASESAIAAPDAEDVRGGNPRRRFLSAPGSAVQSAWYTDGALRGELSAVIGAPLTPAGLGGTYTYYVGPGDFIAIHRDIVTCDVALVTCLHDNGGRGNCGATCLWPSRVFEPLSVVRADPERGAVVQRLEPGDSLLLLGGVVPHAVLPVDAGQRRVVSVLCFEVPPDR